VTSDYVQAPTVFEGLPRGDYEHLLGVLESRTFGSGEIVLAEGDDPHEMYVVQSGTADIFVTDRDGAEHLVGRVQAGTTLGEMSLFTGQPSAATVRASSDLDVLVVSENELESIGATFPRIYRNLGMVLSERLAQTNRRTLRKAAGRLTVLHGHGAPPLLGYALACSIAWHARAPTLLVVIDDDPPEVLGSLATATRASDLRSQGESAAARTGRRDLGAELIVATAAGAFGPDMLAATLEDLCARYEHVLVQVRGGALGGLADARMLELRGPDASPAVDTDVRTRTLALGGWTTTARHPNRGALVEAPALTTADELALRDGLLPSSSEAGGALGSVARDLAGLRVGLALGGGSSKGYAHLGVLRALASAGVSFDCVAGTSIGASMAMGHALGLQPEELADLLDRFAKQAFRPRVPRRSLLSASGLRKELRSLLGEACFEDAELPAAVAAADLATQREVVFTRGLIWPALLASMAIPGIYPPQIVSGMTLVDGGVVNPVPSSAAANLGSDTVIAVRLSGGQPAVWGELTAAEGSGRTPSIVAVILGTIEIMQGKIAANTAAAATILITPAFSEEDSIPLRHFTQGRRYLELGEDAAEAALPRIRAALPWLRD
jgi:NTE family protein